MFKSKKAKKVTSVALLSLLMGVFVLSSSVLVYAENTDINEIGGTTTVETTVTEQQSNISNSQTANQSNATTSNTATTTNTNNGTSGGNQVTQNAGKNESTAEAVGDLFSAAGVDSESAAKAKKWIEPVAKVLNTVTAVILGLFASMLILVSVLDMVYLGIPITRQWLCPGGADMGAGAAAGGMAGGMGGMGMGGMGMGGYGRRGMGRMGMGGMGMGGMGGMGGAAQAQPTLGASIGRWISDDALAAVNESQNGMAAAGGMAGGAMGMQPGMAPATGKNVMFAYLKKRAFSLVMLGVCLVLFSCTVFTDLGITVGTKIIGLLTGIAM